MISRILNFWIFSPNFQPSCGVFKAACSIQTNPVNKCDQLLVGAPAKDTVELVRISLRLHEGFAAAVGAPNENSLRLASIERTNDGAGLDVRLAHGAITKID